MCIFVVSRDHPEYPLILIDNRDESLSRETQAAHWWEGGDIYAPKDLAALGTWIGVTKSGRFAVLVNAYQDEKVQDTLRFQTPTDLDTTPEHQSTASKSRGGLAIDFLKSDQPPSRWISMMTQENSVMDAYAGFTLLVGTRTADNTVEYDFLTNTGKSVPPPNATVALSNGNWEDKSWTKTEDAMHLFHPMLQSHEDLTSLGFQLLSTKSANPPTTRQELRHHIYIPAFPIRSGEEYGTRTQTVVLLGKDGTMKVSQRDVFSGQQGSEVFDISRNTEKYPDRER